MKDKLRYIESLVAAGESAYAMRELLNLSSENDFEARKEIILASSKFNRLRLHNSQVVGKYSTDEVEQHYFRIDSKILDCLDLIRQEYEKFEEKKQNFEFLNVNIAIPKLLRTPLQQYFIFFSDFVKVAKGVDLAFEVLQNELGLEISIDNKLRIPLDTIQDWLSEYIGFTKITKEDMKVKVEAENLSDEEYEILIIELKNQVTHLNNSLELLKKKSKDLKQENNNLKKIVNSGDILKIDSPNSIILTFERARELVSSGKTEKALEILIYFTVEETDIQNELRLQFSRINTLNLDFRLGLIDDSLRYKELAKINKAVLDLIESLMNKKKD